MANKQPSWKKQAGITPGKLMLIAVLAVVLGGVLYIQFAPQSSSSPPPLLSATPTVAAMRKPPVRNLEGAPALPSETATPRKKTGEVGSWHSPELTPIVAHDPFALPAAFPQPTQVDEQGALAQSAAVDPSVQQAALEAERTKSEGELAGLREQGVAVVIKKKKEWYAIVGDQEVHVGDQINGFTVIAIDAGGVRVAKDLSP